jgi:hypothetical protein
MFAALSPEVRGPQLMRELGISNAFVSALCGIESTKLSFAFRQLKALSNDDGSRLMETLSRLVAIQENVRPLAVDLSSPEAARKVLIAFEGQDAETIREKVSLLFE